MKALISLAVLTLGFSAHAGNFGAYLDGLVKSGQEFQLDKEMENTSGEAIDYICVEKAKLALSRNGSYMLVQTSNEFGPYKMAQIEYVEGQPERENEYGDKTVQKEEGAELIIVKTVKDSTVLGGINRQWTTIVNQEKGAIYLETLDSGQQERVCHYKLAN